MNKLDKNKLSTRDITHTALFTALTAAGAFITIPIGPVPITMQSFFVLLSGLILGHKKAVLSQITYLLIGLMGFPVFAGFTGGLQSVFKVSFGFIIGYIAAAYITGKLTEGKNLSHSILLKAVLAGSMAIYAFGLPYMYFILNIMLKSNLSIIKILQIGMFAFIPGDLIKALVIVFITKNINKIIRYK